MATVTEPWEPPIPLRTALTLPTFPTRLLSPWLADWCEAESEEAQVPLDMPACLVLAAAGAGLAGKVEIEPWDGWNEPCNIFVAPAMLSGERKTKVFRDVVQPIIELEIEELERMKSVIAERESERRMLEAEMKKAEMKAAAADPAERGEHRDKAKALAKELAAFEMPVEPMYMVDDATPERLSQLLAAHGRMFVAGDEGTAFEVCKGRYSDAPNFDVYLKGHAGSPLRTSRVTRGSSIIDKPALSLALAVQPNVIHGLGEHATMRGRGFLARFLYAFPVSAVGRRKIRSTPMPKRIAATYGVTLRRLWQFTVRGANGNVATITLRFDAAAKAELETFMTWLEPKLGQDGEYFQLFGWASKLAGAIVRIAGIMHVCDHIANGTDWNCPISQAVVNRAVILGREYFLPHAIAAFGVMMEPEEQKDSERVIAWLAKEFRESVNTVKGSVASTTKRDIHAKVFGGSRTVDQTKEVIELLVKHGYLRQVLLTADDHRRGRRPSDRFEVNSLFLKEPGPFTHFTDSQKNDGDAAEF